MVWQVQQVSFRKATLDFQSSGQGSQAVVEALFDGRVFSNAAGLVDWGEPSFQVVVCRDCGTENCEPGNRVQVRALGGARLFMAVDEDDGRHVLAGAGAATLSRELYDTMRDRLDELPVEPAPLSAAEAACLVAAAAPTGLLERGPVSRVRANLLVAASEGTLEEMVPRLEGVLNACASSDYVPVVRKLDASDCRVAFYVNDVAFTEWTPLVQHADGSIGLLVADYSLRVVE